MDDDIIRMAREAGLSHFYDSEGDFSGVTDALLVDADKQRNDERLVEILGPLIALVRADERERIKAKPNVEYERGFIDGMQMQTKSSVDRAVNRMAEPERHFCERCGKRLSQDDVHTCTPLQQIEQAMLGVWQDVPGAVNFGITDPQVEDRLARHGIPMPGDPK